MMQVILVFLLVAYSYCDQPFRRFEYKYGFKPPYIAQKDGSVLFWDMAGSTMASKDNVRITPSLKSQKGMIWNRYQTSFKWWEVEMWIRVTSRGRMGADGLALWYTSERMKGGSVFGSKDQWTGLAIIFDSYDNDNKRNNPYVSAVLNDGSKSFDHDHDGQGQALAGCMRDFRNKPHPVRARVSYFEHVLTLEIHNGITSSDADFDVCFRAENVVLPESGYFGVTAATGGLADDHDVTRFITHSLHGAGQHGGATQQVNEQERERLKSEFDEYERRTRQAKQDYKTAHPDQKDSTSHEEDDEDDLFELGMSRELRQLFEGQGHLFDTVKRLDGKMDQMVGRQERTLSLLSQNAAAAPGSVGGVPPAQGGMSSAPIDLAPLSEQQRQLTALAYELKTTLLQVGERTLQILQQQQRAVGSVQPVGTAGDVQPLLQEIRDGVRTLRRDVSVTAQYVQQPQKSALQTAGCVSSQFVMAALCVQAAILCAVCLAFVEYRAKKQAKKFF